MKKSLKSKLVLARQTIALLDTTDLAAVAGGQRPATKLSQCGDECHGTPTQLTLC
jgi:hypothetical protein